MSAGTFASRLLGVVREMALFALFPVSITDAWSTAWRLPNLFRRLLGEGSLSVSFLPVYVRTRVEDPTGLKSRELLDAFWTLLLLVLAVLTCLGTIFVPQVLELLLQDQFQANTDKMQLTIIFGRIMFSFIFLVSVYAFWMAVLNALGHFAWAAMAPMFFNLAMIVSTLLPQDLLAVPGKTLAWGVLAGGILQAGVLIPQLLKKGVFPRLSLHFRQPEIWRVLKSMGPGLLGMGLLQFATLLNLYFASALAEGSVSYIYLADRLLELPLSLVSVSLGTALLPTLSKFWAQKRLSDFSHTLRKTLFLNWFLALPAALGLLILSEPIIEVLFRWGKFGAASAQATSHVLQIYSLTLLASSSVRVFVPAFYTVHNTCWPALLSGFSIAVHSLFAPWWMRFFSESQVLG
ncbi:MAG: murein biosynthesis integral membrane protein MurJ, partial [Bdellovibrio sp.]